MECKRLKTPSSHSKFAVSTPTVEKYGNRKMEKDRGGWKEEDGTLGRDLGCGDRARVAS